MNAPRQGWPACLVTLLLAAAGFSAAAQGTNTPAATNRPASSVAATAAPATSAPARPAPAAPASPVVAPAPARVESADSQINDSAFRIISERNIFNASRSGGQVRIATRRPARIETFTLVGTMAYDKGAFAFFEGSSSDFTKVVKTDSVIAGYKLVDILAGSVKLEADGREIELPIGSQMRREDEGGWQMAGVAGSSGRAEKTGSSSGRSGDSSSQASRSRRGGNSSSSRRETTQPAGKAPATAAPSPAEQSEILKRLMERREKDAQ